MCIVIICHFIPYVIVYISVKRIYPSNIPFCVHLASELISVDVKYHITYHIDLRHFLVMYTMKLSLYYKLLFICATAAALFTLQLFLT